MHALAELSLARRRVQPRTHSLSVVLPAYNEQFLIELTVRHVNVVLSRLVDDYEIVVCDDGSRDRTAQILGKLQRAAPSLPLKVVTHKENKGYGAALASACDAATKDLIFILDADGQFDVGELVRFLGALDETTDLVIGFREERADPPLRRLNAWGWKQLVNGLFGYTARDIDCAFKLFRRRVWRSMTVHARGATFSAELLVKSRRLGFVIVELPVSHFPRAAGSPTGAHPQVIVRAFRELIALRANLERDLALDPRVTRLDVRRMSV
jgi:glycosyltransferase involved in cell wall biosynthesis